MTGTGGFCRASRGRPASLAFALGLALLAPHAAIARDIAIAIPATTLDAALNQLARVAGVEIISTEPGLRLVRTRTLSGAMPVRRAIALLLDGTGYRAIAIAGGGWRIVRGSPPRPPRPVAPAAPPPPARPVGDIIVTASKQRVPLLRYPGSLTAIATTATAATGVGADMSDVARSEPILQSTQLGPGRNKVFIRGIADSSFNGSSQATASVYLDDVQVNYTGANPGLRLYDMQSVEVLEGPQGTLYGAGAIGGVIRLTSNPVDLDRAAGAVAGGVTATLHGATGADLAGMVNVPLIDHAVGLRIVGYGDRDGGYIDDPRRHAQNVNRVETVGGRAALRVAPGNGWRIDLSGAIQRIHSADGQYADSAADPLVHAARFAQPFTNRLLVGRLIVTKDWASGLRLVSATGVVDYTTSDRFDATALGSGAGSAAIIYNSDTDKELVTQEARLSRSVANGNSWVLGFALISDRDILTRSVGMPDAETEIIGVTNVTQAASLFGEGTLAVTRNLSLTAGARLTTARVDGEPSSQPRSSSFVRGRRTQRVDPTIAVSWRIAPQLATFARFQTGYRTGGLAVATGIGRVADYEADNITVGEVGFRKLRARALGIAFSGSVSIAYWTDIQADLLSRRGAPYTANIGNAQIQTVEGSVDWVPLPGLRANAAFLYTHNRVTGPIADLSTRANRRLPETPPFAAHGDIAYAWRAGSIEPRVGATIVYVGRSVLGTGDLYDISQGDFASVGASAGIRWRNLDFSLAADNLTDTRGNQFAYGNPFQFANRTEATPLRPFNVRFGVAASW